MFDLSGRVAVVTGGSAGLGVEIAMALAGQGADIAILARRKDKLEVVAKEISALGVKCLPVQCDVTKNEDVVNAGKEVLSYYGKVDILVNDAGGGYQMAAESCSVDEWAAIVNLNLVGTFRCCQAFGKNMIENHYGRIINIASMYGLVGSKGTKNLPYAAAKGGVVNMTRGLASEWAMHGITVNAVSPGYFKSEATAPFFDIVTKIAAENTPIHRPGEAGELNAAVCFLASEEASYVLGVTIPCDGGYTCI